MKDRIQNRAVEVSNTYKNLLLMFATGTGKSRAALKIASEHGGKWYIVVAETTHIDNWKREIADSGIEIDCEIFCYQSLPKYTKKANLILDECHHVTEKRMEVIKEIAGERIVGLSATVPPEKLKLLQDFRKFKEIYIPLSTAIELGLVPEPDIRIIRYHLNDSQKNTLRKIQTKLDEAVLSKDSFKSKLLGNKRKSFFANVKLPVLKRVIQKNKHKRMICFTGSVEQCEAVGGRYIIHSKLRKNTIKKVIDSFNKQVSDKLFSVKMLREGVNLTDIEIGVITQLDKKELSFIQMLGRTLRSDFPLLVIIVVADSDDEKTLNRVTNSLSKYIKTYEFRLN